jgi:hypothetical protein
LKQWISVFRQKPKNKNKAIENVFAVVKKWVSNVFNQGK